MADTCSLTFASASPGTSVSSSTFDTHARTRLLHIINSDIVGSKLLSALCCRWISNVCGFVPLVSAGRGMANAAANCCLPKVILGVSPYMSGGGRANPPQQQAKGRRPAAPVPASVGLVVLRSVRSCAKLFVSRGAVVCSRQENLNHQGRSRAGSLLGPPNPSASNPVGTCVDGSKNSRNLINRDLTLVRNSGISCRIK